MFNVVGSVNKQSFLPDAFEVISKVSLRRIKFMAWSGFAFFPAPDFFLGDSSVERWKRVFVFLAPVNKSGYDSIGRVKFSLIFF